MRSPSPHLVLAGLLALAAACAAPAEEDAASSDAAMMAALAPRENMPAAVIQALDERRIGEAATGYLEIVEAADEPALWREVSAINIRRRALYTEMAQEQRVRPQTIARVFACLLFNRANPSARMYRLEDGSWFERAPDAPARPPSFCR